MATILITRKEAENKLQRAGVPKGLDDYNSLINSLVALGLLHLQPETLNCYKEYTPENGIIELMKRNDKYSLWYHGKCVWSNDK